MQKITITVEEKILARELAPSALTAAAIMISAKTCGMIREPSDVVVELAGRLARDTAISLTRLMEKAADHDQKRRESRESERCFAEIEVE